MLNLRLMKLQIEQKRLTNAAARGECMLQPVTAMRVEEYAWLVDYAILGIERLKQEPEGGA